VIKETNVPLKARASSDEAVQEGKVSNPKDVIPPTKDAGLLGVRAAAGVQGFAAACRCILRTPEMSHACNWL
jgi:hypothetical protein